MRKGSNPKFIHVAQDGMILTPDRNNHEQSSVLDLDPTTRILGVNLGSDFCAEHEWGIKELNKAFGVKSDIAVYGLKKRKITTVPKSLVWVTLSGGREGFAYRNYWYDDNPLRILNENNDLKVYEHFDRGTRQMVPNPVQLAGAWSESDFGAVSSNPDDIKNLREIFEQFKKKNIIFTFSGSLAVFDNPGLIIAIADRMPKATIQMFLDADKEAHETEKFTVKSGIRELLEKAGKRYFYLGAKRKEDGTYHFWLNPYEQNVNRACWCTLDDLRAWAKGEGVIPFTPAELIEKEERRTGKKLVTQ